MSKFKIGDKVKCLRGYRCEYTNDGQEIVQDNIYIVEKICAFSNNLKLIGNDPGYWSADRFQIVENPMPELKSGMRVQHRNGQIFLVIKDLDRLFQVGGFNHLADFNVNTGEYQSTYGVELKEWDIVKVFKGHTTSDLLNLQNLGSVLWESDPAKIAKQKRAEELNEIIEGAKAELETLEN